MRFAYEIILLVILSNARVANFDGSPDGFGRLKRIKAAHHMEMCGFGSRILWHLEYWQMCRLYWNICRCSLFLNALQCRPIVHKYWNICECAKYWVFSMPQMVILCTFTGAFLPRLVNRSSFNAHFVNVSLSGSPLLPVSIQSTSIQMQNIETNDSFSLTIIAKTLIPSIPTKCQPNSSRFAAKTAQPS